MSYPGFKQIAFDLDDTLLDTTHLLIPKAAQESCQAMIEAGLKTNLSSCLEAREEMAQSPKRLDLYSALTQRFGVVNGKNADVVSEIGRKTFYNREVDADISLFDGAEELLRHLGTKYRLHLVTAGHRPTQEAKIRILNLDQYIPNIHHVDPTRNESKSSVFSFILKESGAAAQEHLSVGNRLDTDIGEAKRAGWRTCWLRHGEHASYIPVTDFEKPDYTISSLKELIPTCRL